MATGPARMRAPAARSGPRPVSASAIAALVALVAMINAANLLAVIVRQKGGSYQPGMFASMTG